jgi:hypothetical protein
LRNSYCIYLANRKYYDKISRARQSSFSYHQIFHEKHSVDFLLLYTSSQLFPLLRNSSTNYRSAIENVMKKDEKVKGENLPSFLTSRVFTLASNIVQRAFMFVCSDESVRSEGEKDSLHRELFGFNNNSNPSKKKTTKKKHY